MREILKPACSLIVYFTVTMLLTGCSNSHQLANGSDNNTRHSRFINNMSLGSTSRKSRMTGSARRAHATEVEERSEPVVINPNPINNNDHPIQNNSFAIQIKYATILGIVPAAINNISLYNFIDDWYGVRYRLGGNDKSGIDCSAFVQRLYENVFGTTMVRTALEQFNSCHMVWNAEEAREGDLIFFYSYTYSRARRHHKSRIIGRHIAHVGIYLANNFFVHASTSNGVTISNLKDEYWAAKFAGAGEVPRG